MRQSTLLNLTRAAICAFLMIFAVSCQTDPLSQFSKVKVGMNKDDVLDIVGSPRRAERFDGKEKWAYKYYSGSDKDQEELRQITFENDKVISVGEDKEEEDRIKDIQKDDDERAARRKIMEQNRDQEEARDIKTGRVPGEEGMTTTPAEMAQPQAPDQAGQNPSSADELKPQIPTESDFVEVKGKRSPVKSDDSDNK